MLSKFFCTNTKIFCLLCAYHRASRFPQNISIFKVDELARPLVLDDANARDQGNEITRSNDLEGAYSQNEGLLRPPRTHGLKHKQRLPSASPQSRRRSH